jgi:hypothetical protein
MPCTPSSSFSAPSSATRSADSLRSLTLQWLAMPAWLSDVDRLVGVVQLDVLADDGDLDGVLGVLDDLQQALPVVDVELPLGLQLQVVEDALVEAGLDQHQRHFVDRERDVALLDDGLGPHVAEQRDLLRHVGVHGDLGAADERVRLDADLAQLADRLLRRLGLQLARRAQERQQRQVDEHAVVRPVLEAELADRLEERQALDVADGAADLGDGDVGSGLAVARRGAGADRHLDLVGDVRDHLHGLAEVVAAALLLDHRLVDLAGRVVGVLVDARVREALVVAEVEVGLGAVVGDVDLAVLERRHRAGVDVDVGVELLHRHLEAVALEDPADGGGGQAFAERRDDASGHEQELGHRAARWFTRRSRKAS